MAKKNGKMVLKAQETQLFKVDNLTEEEFNKILGIRFADDESLSREANDQLQDTLMKKIMIILINNTDVVLPEENSK